jgi:hypothetical protein
MGLDNGIEIKRKDNLPNCVLCFDDDEWRKQRGYDLEVAYWRKCWNVRGIIFSVIDDREDDCVYNVTREELVEIIHRLENDLHYFDFLEGEWGSCIWEWNDFRRIQKWNIKNLKKLARMMKRHPEIEVIFYDSY